MEEVTVILVYLGIMAFANKLEAVTSDLDLILESGHLIIDTDDATMMYFNEVDEGTATSTILYNETVVSYLAMTDNSTTPQADTSTSTFSHWNVSLTKVKTDADETTPKVNEELTSADGLSTLSENITSVKATPSSTSSNQSIETSTPDVETPGSTSGNTNQSAETSTSDHKPIFGNSTDVPINSSEVYTSLSRLSNASSTPLLSDTYKLLFQGTLKNVTYKDTGSGEEWNYSIAIFSTQGSIELKGNLTISVIGGNALRFQSKEGNILIGSDINLNGREGISMLVGGFQGLPSPGGGADDSSVPGGAGHGGHGGGSFRESQTQPCSWGRVDQSPSDATSIQSSTSLETEGTTHKQTANTPLEANYTTAWNDTLATANGDNMTGTTRTEMTGSLISQTDTSSPSGVTVSHLLNDSTLDWKTVSKTLHLNTTELFPGITDVSITTNLTEKLNSTLPNDDSDTTLESTVMLTDPINSTSTDLAATTTDTPTGGDEILYRCTYGFPYLLESYRHLLGGSPGGIASQGVARMGGGGAIEFRARKGSVTIDALVTARGQSVSKPEPGDAPCRGGGSGGLIRVRAKAVLVTPRGSLVVSGGDGSTVGCGGDAAGGGAGGVIQIKVSEMIESHQSFLLSGGFGSSCSGQDGFLSVVIEGGSGGGDGGCQCNTGPPPFPPFNPSPSSMSTPAAEITHAALLTNSPTDMTTFLPKDMTPDEAADYLKDIFTADANLTNATTSTEAAQIMGNIEQIGLKFGRILAKRREPGETINITVISEELAMQLDILEASSFSGHIIPGPDLKSSNATSRPGAITIHQSVLPTKATGSVIIVGTFYVRMEQFLSGALATPSGLEAGYDINSVVLSATLELTDNSPNFIGGVSIAAANHEKSTGRNTLCAFWNFSQHNDFGGAWSTSGCSVNVSNGTYTVCTCDHLTNFAVLLKPTDFILPPGHERALEILTYVGLGLSLACLVVALVTLAALLRSLKNTDSAVIHLNLVIALTVADFFFLVGASDTGNKVWCKTVAGILHYTYTVTFMWMLMEGIYLYIRVVHILHQPSRTTLKYFFLAAWGLPIVIVSATVLARPESYGSDQACWLDTANGAIWAFAGPVLVIIGVNIVFLAVVMVRFVSVKSIAKQSKWKQTRKTTRAAVILLPLLGISWLFGLLSVDKNTLIFMYLFVIFNSLQGVFIFVFHCLTNDDVISTIRIKLRKSRSRFDFHHSWPNGIKTAFTRSPVKKKKKNSVHPSTQTSITLLDRSSFPSNVGHWTDVKQRAF
ncbi:uncharacterized protein LOC110990059 [Acanthaster planci]|uniref:Uncharacterized protein LOC110990059 n=1 Tax=Acanthaster planci TaxID=133434 RepID=A0A8B7ZZL8_ACAPL|nr:uncharacterized protein LOC110990059 [Acanthaster planci]